MINSNKTADIRRRMSNFCRLGTFVLGLVLISAQPAAAVFGDTTTEVTDPILDAIEISGNERTDTGVILREMNLVIGQPLTYDQMDQVWDHLEDLGYFAFVDMELDDNDENHATLYITVEEDLTTHYGPLVRYDRRHKYQLGGWIEDNNFRGKGEILEASVSLYYLQFGQASWTRPWFLGVRNLDLKVGLQAQQANFVFRPTRYKQWDVDLDLRWRFWNDFYVRGAVGYGQDKYRDGYWWNQPYRGEGSATDAVYIDAGTQSRLSLTGAVGFDSRDNLWYPLNGIYAEALARQWQSDDFDTYTETSVDARAFVSTPWDHVIALRGWGRRTNGPTHLDNTLFFGGPETVRGYPFGRLEGEEGYLLSFEYRMPLFLMPISPKGEMVGFGLHAFADAGDAWFHGADAGRAAQSWGVGAHINLDKSQYRFEAARTREGDWQFEFMDTFNF